MTSSYNEIYLDDAMDNLGGAVEYATLVCKMEGQEFLDLFVTSDVAKEFGRGNVKYVSGMSGIELAMHILDKCGKKADVMAELPHIDYPPEYWSGWILAYYQWYSGKPFSTICRKISYDTLDRLYGVLHEADPDKAVSVFDDIMNSSSETNLAAFRKRKGLSQSQLAKLSGVSIRSIQLYEQRQTNINNAQYNHLKALSQILGCKVEDILEP